ncbi:MAG TPA: TPM domain-containing protein [Tepidisphaeraceae bacterium]|nr:TPM domain-containing protein [Tepidisphaeraceae bacterium]
MKRVALFILAVLLATRATARADEVMPPAPSQYVNDYAGVMTPQSVEDLNRELDRFERDTSNQIVVAIFPAMQSDSSIDDYTYRIAESWKVGRKGLNNGAVLFVFIAQRQMFIQTGYGLEGALPDAICKRIIDNEIKPHFRVGDYDGGIVDGVHAMMAATRGEYKGNGSTAHGNGGFVGQGIPPIVIFIAIFVFISFLRRATSFGGYGRRSFFYIGPPFFGGWGGGGGGGWSGGGGGGGGGGFSGGGGGFGGGGAGGSW